MSEKTSIDVLVDLALHHCCVMRDWDEELGINQVLLTAEEEQLSVARNHIQGYLEYHVWDRMVANYSSALHFLDACEALKLRDSNQESMLRQNLTDLTSLVQSVSQFIEVMTNHDLDEYCD